MSYKTDLITKKVGFYDMAFVNIKTGARLNCSRDPGRIYFSIVEDYEKATDTKEPEFTEPLNGWYKIKTWDEMKAYGLDPKEHGIDPNSIEVSDWYIETPDAFFTREMDALLPKEGKIYIKNSYWEEGNRKWKIKPWMIKKKLSDKDSKVMDISRIKATVVKEPLKEFKVGHWYRYIGPKELPGYFADSGDMDFVLDGQPLKCISVFVSGSRYAADFGDGHRWIWHLEDFEEIKEIREEDVIKIECKIYASSKKEKPFIGKRQRVINALRGNKE
jgi:hypothetical protein